MTAQIHLTGNVIEKKSKGTQRTRPRKRPSITMALAASKEAQLWSSKVLGDHTPILLACIETPLWTIKR